MPRCSATGLVKWIEQVGLRIPEGKFVGRKLVLADYMREDFELIYDNPHGTRRAIISRGRKNAKTVEAAIILLAHLAGPMHKPNSQLYSAAQSRDQAAILFHLAVKMVRMSESLNAHIQVGESAKTLRCPSLGTVYRALSAEASTNFGLSPSLIVHDELGQVKGPRSPMYEALETATAAQEDPLSIIISTQAPTDGDLLSILIDDALTGADPHTVVRLDTAPSGLDTFSEEAIRAANPAFGLFMNREEVLEMAAAASRMPARQPQFENLVLNRRCEANSPFISRELWKSCGDDPLPFDKNTPVYGGLDLSEVRDLTALVLVGLIDGVWHVHPTFWLPAEGITEKSVADRVPYDTWSKSGFLQLCPGRSVDYKFVARHLRDHVFAEMNVRRIAFDRWAFRHLKPWLREVGFSEKEIENHFVEFGQGFASMTPALRDLESEILNGNLAHGNHPVLTMCASNAVVETNAAGGRKLAKHKSTGRIDGMVALAMAVAAAPPKSAEPNRDYQMMFF